MTHTFKMQSSSSNLTSANYVFVRPNIVAAGGGNERDQQSMVVQLSTVCPLLCRKLCCISFPKEKSPTTQSFFIYGAHFGVCWRIVLILACNWPNEEDVISC